VKLANYGIAFTKDTARKKGVNPVWYVNMTPGFTWETAQALDALRDEAKASSDFGVAPRLEILPFVEQTGTWITSRKEFSWEREWRHRGGFTFSDLDVALVLCPESEIDDFEALGPYAAVDPSWSLERIIASITRSRALYVAIEMRRERRRAREAEAASDEPDSAS